MRRRRLPNIGKSAAKMLGEESVEADDEHAESSIREATRLLGRKESLARPRTASDRRSRMPLQHVEDVVLLLGQSQKLPLFFGELDRQRCRNLERLRERAFDLVDSGGL